LLSTVLLAQALLLAAWAWPAPLQDLPNHLARAVAIADLAFDGGARFGAWYELHWAFAPYVLADALAAGLVKALGAEPTARLMAAAAAVAVPLALAWCARALGASRAAAALAGLASAVFALDYTLAAGYLAFKYSAALSLVAVGCMVRVIEAPRPARVVALVAAACATYLAHLAGFVMFVAAAAALAAEAWLSRRRLPPGAVAGLAVAGAIGALHVLGSLGGDASPAYHFGTAAEKLHGALQSLAMAEQRAERAIDLAALAALAAGVALASAAALRGEGRVRRALWLGASALAAYVALPQSQPGFTWDTDLRALPQVFGFAALALALAVESRPALRSAVALALATLATLQIAVLAGPLRADALRVAALREAQAALPAGARVFPVVSVGLVGRLNPLLHAPEYALVDQGAFAPYVFAGHGAGHLGHFRLRAVAEPIVEHRWYAGAGSAPDAVRLLSGYDHVSATLPWDERRLGLCLEPLRRTTVAASYRIVGLRRADGSCDTRPRGAGTSASR
jgi:hypothetical protein